MAEKDSVLNRRLRLTPNRYEGDSDPLESRFDKISKKYLNNQNGVCMKSWRTSQVVSILQSESNLRDASSLLIQSIVPE
jgi:hypothetical protein